MDATRSSRAKAAHILGPSQPAQREGLDCLCTTLLGEFDLVRWRRVSSVRGHDAFVSDDDASRDHRLAILAQDFHRLANRQSRREDNLAESQRLNLW